MLICGDISTLMVFMAIFFLPEWFLSELENSARLYEPSVVVVVMMISVLGAVFSSFGVSHYISATATLRKKRQPSASVVWTLQEV